MFYFEIVFLLSNVIPLFLLIDRTQLIPPLSKEQSLVVLLKVRSHFHFGFLYFADLLTAHSLSVVPLGLEGPHHFSVAENGFLSLLHYHAPLINVLLLDLSLHCYVISLGHHTGFARA